MVMEKITFLKDLYSFPGFRAQARIKLHPEHQGAMIVTLRRRQKKRFVAAERLTVSGMTIDKGLFATLAAAVLLFIWNLTFAASNVQNARL